MSDKKLDDLTKRLALLKLENSALHLEGLNRNLSLTNGMGNLVPNEFQQDNLTSITPLITANIYSPITLNYNLLVYMYQTHGLLQTAIDEPVADAFRGQLNFTSKELTQKNIEELEAWAKEYKVWPARDLTWIWSRLFGGAALVVNSPTDPRMPVGSKDLNKGRFALYPATRWELGSGWRFADTYSFYGIPMDKSRVLTLGGKEMPWVIARQLSGWGASVIARMVEDFNLFLRTRNVLYEILNEAKLDVYKFEGFKEQLATAQGEADTQRRVAIMNSIKNYHQALMLDKNDDYEQKQLTFSGLSEVMKENRVGLAAALRMPMTKLWGLSASGFNSGEDDIENYNAMVESEIRTPARPFIHDILKLGMMAIWGRDDAHIEIEYPPLRVMGADEEEKVRTSKQNRIVQLLEIGMIDDKTAAAWLLREKLVPVAMTVADLGMDRAAAMAADDDETQGADKNGRRAD